MKKTTVLLAGIGGYGALYLKELLDAKDPPFVLVGVADPFAAASPRFAELKERGIPVFASPEEFFKAGGAAELSVIASPIHTHYPYVVCCYQNGSHVLCEKPVSADMARLDELIALEEKTGLFCGVGFQQCFSWDVLALKKDILAGVFGKPLNFKAYEMTRRGDKYYSRNNWAGKLAVDGETILDSPLCNGTSHDLQTMLFLLGDTLNSTVKINSLDAELWKARPDIENHDAEVLRVHTEKCPVYFYTAHCVDLAGTGPVGEFKFEKATIRWCETRYSGYKAYFNDGSVKSYEQMDKGIPVMQKLYDCANAVQTKTTPVCTLKTARAHLECVLMAQKFPVKKVPVERLVYDKFIEPENPWYYIPGLSDAFIKCYNEGVLPGETGFNP
jgi:predicted dehydrogenase